MRKTSETTPPTEPRVLLINDNRHGLLARRTVLSGEGYAVTATDTAAEALTLFRDEAFDLVVTDDRMPQMNGADLIREFRQMRPEVPVILVSAMVDVLGLNEHNTGADAVVAKNALEVSHMVRAVNRLLRRHTPPRKPVRSQIGRRAIRAKSS